MVIKLYKTFFSLLYVCLVFGTPFDDDQREQDSSSLEAEDVEGVKIYRLPDHVHPISYKLKLNPDMTKLTFKGSIEIAFWVKISTNEFALHSSDLSIKECFIQQESSYIKTTYKEDKKNEILSIRTEDVLKFDSNYVLTIKFEGTMSNDNKGLYKSSYVLNTKKKWLAATQFESTYARRAFPCFDEPKFKTPFTISIARYRNYRTISNMPIEQTTKFPDFFANYKIWDIYKTTPPLPTYLVSFIICEFSVKSDPEKFINVYVRENAQDHVSYALQQSQKLIKNMEDFVSFGHGLSKLDVVGLPDFEMGAMENWGMTTYRESKVILDDSKCSELQKEGATRVISHEFSHQWFGDLVTLAWWDYLWLNEGFARYFEYFNARQVEPTWDLEERFITEVVHYALYKEVDVNRAMTTRVEKVSQIDDVFDVISYAKGASVIRMFEHILTTDVFRAGLKQYLKDGVSAKKGTVVPDDLFNAFENQAIFNPPLLPPRVSVSDVMKLWTENIGYPVITVKICHHTKTATFVQSTYKSLRSRILPPNQEWIVPISFTTKSKLQFLDTSPSLWSFAGKPIKIFGLSDGDWVLCNLQQTGYYRVNYCPYGWKQLIKQLKEDHKAIPVINRAQLIDDSFVLALDDWTSFEVPIQLATYLEKENDVTPWVSASNQMERLFLKFHNTKFFHKLHMFIQSVMEKAYQNLGFNIKSTDNHIVKVSKPRIMDVACQVGVEKCIDDSLGEFQKNIDDISKVQPDLKKVVLCNALRYGENPQNIYEKVWTAYLQSNIAYDKTIFLSTLGCAKDEEVIKRTIGKLLDEKNEEIRSQDTIYITQFFFTFTESVTTTIKYLIERVPTFKDLSENKIFFLHSIIKKLSAHVQTEVQINLLKELSIQLKTSDEKKYEKLIKSVTKAYTDGIKRIKTTEKLSEYLSEVLYSIEKGETPKNRDESKEETNNKPSEQSSAISLSASFSAAFSTLIAIFIYTFN